MFGAEGIIQQRMSNITIKGKFGKVITQNLPELTEKDVMECNVYQ